MFVLGDSFELLNPERVGNAHVQEALHGVKPIDDLTIDY